MDLCNCEILKIASIRALPYISRGGFFLFFYFTEIVEVKNKSKELYYYNYYYNYYNYSVIVLSLFVHVVMTKITYAINNDIN